MTSVSQTALSKTMATNQAGVARPAPRAARIGMAMLDRLDTGRLNLITPDGQTHQYGSGSGTQAEIRLANWKVFAASMRSGDIGFAESYIRHDWDSDNLVDTLKLLVANRQALEKAVYGSWAGRLIHRLSHLLNRNSKRGARRNIHAHYDLGNSFYSLWLDPSMTYSSALFSDPAHSLEQAQQAKYQRILSQASCPSEASILEIGCGWGGFAEIASAKGHRVRGLTLSTEQRNYAVDRMTALKRSDRTEFVIQDYRDETTQFDAVVSIEMFEAVGEQYWPAYFQAIKRCLKPGAKAVVQTITIDDALFERYRAGSDFIQQYIFPGGMLPSIERFSAAAANEGLTITDTHAFGKDYGRTLELWGAKFRAQLAQVEKQGFDDRFIRTWAFYLAYCEAAFEHGNTNVCQFTLQAG